MSLHLNNNEKEPTRHPSYPLPSGKEATTKAISKSVSALTVSGKAPLTRELLGDPPTGVNMKLQFCGTA
jgi:hypothetical protein